MCVSEAMKKMLERIVSGCNASVADGFTKIVLITMTLVVTEVCVLCAHCIEIFILRNLTHKGLIKFVW